MDTSLGNQLEDIAKKLKATNPKKLPSLEADVKGKVDALQEAEAPFAELMPTMMKLIVDIDEEYAAKVLEIGGSVSEGASMARIFQLKKIWRECEVDITYNFSNLPIETREVIESVEGKPGVVKIPYDPIYPKYIEPFLPERYRNQPKYFVPLSKTQYLSPHVLKENLRRFSKFQSRCLIKCLKLLFGSCELLGGDSDAETTTEVNIAVKASGNMVHISMDHVPALKLLFWPLQAQAWINRPRNYPSRDIIQSIVDKGCQIVPLSSLGGDIHSECQLSFSSPEEELAKLRSKEQQRALYFITMLFYRYLKCVQPAEAAKKGLHSYIVKTTMLWGCEQYAPDDPVWQDFEKSVQLLLSKLVDALQRGCLPHYFIPEINLLEQCGEDVKQKCISIIEKIQKNIFMAAPFDIDEKLEFVRWLRSTVDTCRMILAARPEGGVLVYDFLKGLLGNPQTVPGDGISFGRILKSASKKDLDLDVD